MAENQYLLVIVVAVVVILLICMNSNKDGYKKHPAGPCARDPKSPECTAWRRHSGDKDELCDYAHKIADITSCAHGPTQCALRNAAKTYYNEECY